MMNIICILSLITIVALNTLITKKLFSYSNIFHFLWIVIVFTYSLDLYDLYKVEDTTMLYIILGNFCFFLGAVARRHMKNRRIILFRSKKESADFSYNAIMFFLFIHLATSIFFSFRTFNLMRQGYAYGYIRNIYQGYTDLSYTYNQIEDILRNWAALPLGTVIPAIAVACILQKRKYKLFYIIAVLDQLLYLFYSQNRATIAYIAVYFAVVIANRWKKTDKKMKKRIKILIVVMISAIIVVSKTRFGVGESTAGRTIYRYICGCIPFMDIKIADAERLGYQTYGMSFLYGILTPIESLLGATPLGKTPFYQYVDGIMMGKEKWIRIGDRTFMNAYTTLFYDFYLDFKVFGICIGCFIFGHLIESAYRRFRNFNNTKDLAISLTYSIAIVMSMVRWQFGSAAYFMAFAYFFVMSRFDFGFLKRLKSR